MERNSLKKQIVVTGGLGFIGSHVTALLCDLGHSVTVIDDLSFGFKKFIDKRAKIVTGSVGNRKLLESILPGNDVVIHLAASSIIKFSFQKPQEYFENNVMNGIVLLETMRKTGVKKIIYSSTASVYGEPEKVPIRESDTKNPMTVYGASKLAFESALNAYYYSFGIQSVSLRYFNAYGPHDEQIPATRAVPIWIQAILENKPILLYWEGKQLRDYVFVRDIARAHIAVLDLNGVNVYNIGCGRGVLMENVLKTLEKISGKKITIKDMGKRSGDPQKLVADISKIKQEVGWEPETKLAEGLQETYKYYESVHQTNLQKS